MAKAKGRPKKPGGEGVPVRLDREIVRKGRVIASELGEPLSDYLSRHLRPVIDREYQKVVRGLLGPDPRDKGHKP